MKPISPEEFSNLVGSLYDCALDPKLWEPTLTALRERLDFANAAIDLYEMPTGRAMIGVRTGMGAEWQRATPDYAAAMVDQWGGAERIGGYPLDQPLLLSDLNPVGLTRANRYWADWGEPNGVIDVVAIGLARDRASVSTVALSRHRDCGPVGAGEIDALRLLTPHLKRAVTISRLLDARAVEAATLQTVLDGLSVGVLLVDRDLRLVHANRVGAAQLAAAAPLGLRAGRLAGAPGLLAALAVAVAGTTGGIGARGLGVPARGGDGAEMVLHVLPIVPGSPSQALAPSVVAAIFVAPAVTPRPAPLKAVAALFDLTPAEARVLELIGGGRTNAETAAALGVGVSTVRTHLLRIFDKTGTRRQADLVALLATFSLPI